MYHNAIFNPIFADRKSGAIAHPDSYREVEQRSDSYRNENPCVPGSIAIWTIPGEINQLIVLVLTMDFICYIIHSKSMNRYYVGHTSDFGERIKMHNDGHFGGKTYTSRAKDWEEFLLIPCLTVKLAVSLEMKIKRMKSRKYIENLKRYPDLIDKIIRECGN